MYRAEGDTAFGKAVSAPAPRFVSLTRSGDFKLAYIRGKRSAAKEMVVYTRANGLSYDRYGFSINRKVGNAVVRNKVKRRFKEILRLRERGCGVCGSDFVVVAKPEVAYLDYSRMRDILIQLLDRLTRK